MGYAILRVQKLKSPVAVHRSMKHAFRDQETPNADPDRTLDNSHVGARSVSEGMIAFRRALPEKMRKNAVLAVEYLVTASPKEMAEKTRRDQDTYFQDALNWLRKRHGAENVIYAGIHRDEKTPHMYAYVVPKDPETGRLNCRRFLGGAKALREMQTDFAESVGQNHGLERGIEGSRANHRTVQAFYGALNQELGHATIFPSAIEPKVLEKAGLLDWLRGWGDLVEDSSMVAERLTKAVRQGYDPVVRAAVGAREMAEKVKEVQKTAQSLRDRLRPFEELLGPLSATMREKAVQAIRDLGEKLQEEQAERSRQLKEARAPKKAELERVTRKKGKSRDRDDDFSL